MPGKNKQSKKMQRPRPSGRGLPASEAPQDSGGWFRPLWARHHLLITSAGAFLVLVGLFIFIYSRLITSGPFEGFMAFTARITAAMLKVVGQGVVVDRTIVTSPRFSFQIVDLCTAIMPMMIFAAAVLAFPARTKDKLLGLLAGLAVIFVVNQIRLVSLFFIGAYARSIFETAHLLVWQSLMILLAIGLWLIWAYKYARTAAV